MSPPILAAVPSLSAACGQVHLEPLLDLTPSNEAPVLLHAPTEGHLLALLGAHWGCELQLGQITLDLKKKRGCKTQTGTGKKEALLCY